MKVGIYYGGRGIIEDPSLYVLDRITEVLRELRADVARYNLYEQKSGIAMLANTLKDADAVILAVSVEWYGIGGLMQQFLDACWLYADKQKLSKLYMFPVVISTVPGERESEYALVRAWETLGGHAFRGICAYVGDHSEFEADASYREMIEKYAEDIYRTVHQKGKTYPTSFGNSTAAAVGVPTSTLTPQESEQLTEYVSNDTFVKKQKADVEELSNMYRNILDKGREEGRQEFVKQFKDAFMKPEDSFTASYKICMTDTGRNLLLEVAHGELRCAYVEDGDAASDVTAKTTRDIVNRIVNGKVTFQGAFMSGQLTSKGDFKLLRSFDALFRFE